MIVLEFPEGLNEVSVWKERLEKMTVGHQLLATSITIPQLTNGKEKVKGITHINHYLDQYEADVAQWNQDRCDMWFFDE